MDGHGMRSAVAITKTTAEASLSRQCFPRVLCVWRAANERYTSKQKLHRNNEVLFFSIYLYLYFHQNVKNIHLIDMNLIDIDKKVEKMFIHIFFSHEGLKDNKR